MNDTAVERVDAAARVPLGCPVIHLDASPPLEAGSHWAIANELREASPTYFNTHAQGYWMFTRYDEVREMYQHPEIFSSESITPWEPDPVYRFVPTQIDPPEHSSYRQLVSRWFAPSAVRRIEPQAHELGQRLVRDFAARGECDFVTDFAMRLPTEIFLTIIGVPHADADLFVPWVEDFFAGFGGDLAQQEAMGAALGGMRQYWVDVLAARRSEAVLRDGDFVAMLIHSEIDGLPLGDDLILDILTVLVLAGLDTTRGQLGYLFRHLAENPGDRKRLVAEPELIPLAVEESLRLYTIIFGDGRKVAQDTDFHGCPLSKGDMVYGLVSGANRDPRVYDRPDEFVVDRKANNHLGFAGGPHRCLGAHLARMVMRVAVEEWLAVIPDFEIATGEPLLERGGGAMMTLLGLPLRWEVPA
ncbi:MAG: cytochrome P450 [Marmoricola sp.]